MMTDYLLFCLAGIMIVIFILISTRVEGGGVGAVVV